MAKFKKVCTIKHQMMVYEEQTWKVEFHERPIKLDGKRVHGDTDYKARLIRVYLHPKPIENLDTLIHELLHAAYPQINERSIVAGADLLTTALVEYDAFNANSKILNRKSRLKKRKAGAKK